jgi:hypothetical protein
MHKVETQRRASQPGTGKAECCTDAPCESGLRNNYFEGKRLTADSFRVEQQYLVERRHLLNRAIHGWGVVYGYALKAAAPDECGTDLASGRIEIGPGLALDQCGRELLHARRAVLSMEDVIVLDEKGTPVRASDCDLANGHPQKTGGEPTQACWLLSAHYAEQAIGPVTINDPCSCERSEWDHTCETVRFSLRRVDCAECCDRFDCELQCGCGTGPCCDQHPTDDDGKQRDSGTPQSRRSNRFLRGGCQCLCEYLTGLQPGADCCSLREIEEACARVRVDLRNGVPLACVRLRQDDCEKWIFDDWVEACGPRRLVKRNDALFDLIRGCDLTRISAIGWARWHRSRTVVPWSAFMASFGNEEPAESGRNITQDYWVEFSRPVRDDTVRVDCFTMTVTVAEHEAGWGESRRVPIVGVVTSAAPGAPGGFITRATLVVDAGWVDDAIESRKTIFNQDEAWVEIEIRGDFIVDCNGQTIDANAVGLSPSPTGNGTPGGTFHSNFRVAARETAGRAAAPYDTAQRAQGVQS